MFYVSIGFTLIYLLSIYILPPLLFHHRRNTIVTTTTTAINPRNDPKIIKPRLLSVILATGTSFILLPYILPTPTTANTPSLQSLLGFTLPATLNATFNLILYPTLLTISLFSGSLLVQYYQQSLITMRYSTAWQSTFDWTGIRNYIIGPITEELVFRSIIITVAQYSGATNNQIIFLTPLYFGIAHVHHAYETYVTGGRTLLSLKRGMIMSTFQFAYTTLFGWYASYLFIRTGSILPPIIAHMFCNVMGLPPIAWALKVYSTPIKRGLILSTYAIGIFTFIYQFQNWTRPTLFGQLAHIYQPQ